MLLWTYSDITRASSIKESFANRAIIRMQWPVLSELLQSLRIDPIERTRSETDTILRYLLLNKRLLNMLENSQRMREAAQSATIVTISNSDVLFYEGDDRDGWYLVLDGTVDVVIRLCLLAEDCFVET